MKKLVFPILGLLLLAFFISCSSDGDGPTPTDDNPVTGGTDDDGVDMVDQSGNELPTGASNTNLLTNANFDRILVQAAHVEGFRPTDEAMELFQDFLRERTFKTQIDIEFLPLPSPNEESLTLTEIRDLEDENRTAYNDGRTLAVYIYFADAPSDSDDEEEGLVTLGAVYRNTSMIIYENTVRRLAARASFLTAADVEATTLNHEFGHLFGLVNLSAIRINADGSREEVVFTPAQNPHEGVTTDDEGNEIGNQHCNVPGCLMQAELQFRNPNARNLTARAFGPKATEVACALSGKSVLAMLEARAAQGFNDVIPLIDPECILDLQNVGGR